MALEFTLAITIKAIWVLIVIALPHSKTHTALGGVVYLILIYQYSIKINTLSKGKFNFMVSERSFILFSCIALLCTIIHVLIPALTCAGINTCIIVHSKIKEAAMGYNSHVHCAGFFDHSCTIRYNYDQSAYNIIVRSLIIDVPYGTTSC